MSMWVCPAAACTQYSQSFLLTLGNIDLLKKTIDVQNKYKETISAVFNLQQIQ